MGDGARGIVIKASKLDKPAKENKRKGSARLARRSANLAPPPHTGAASDAGRKASRNKKRVKGKITYALSSVETESCEWPKPSSPGTGLLGAAVFQKAHNITIQGECPAPFETFSCAKKSFGFELVKALKKQSFANPTPIQATIWPLALEGRDLVAVSATGSGKTCAYLLPAFVRLYSRGSPSIASPARPRVLVLAPTRELIQQIAGEAFKLMIGQTEKRPHYVAIFGGVNKSEQIRKLQKGADLIFATTGRLMDLVAGDPGQGPALTLRDCSYVVLDEADRMLDMGFEADIRNILGGCPKTGDACHGWGASGPKAGTRRQTLLFTATWPKAVKSIAASLTAPGAVQVRVGQVAGDDHLTACSSVKQTILLVSEDRKFGQLQDLLEEELKASETAIVFVATKDKCDRIERLLPNSGMWCGVLHSGRLQSKRSQTLRRFRELTAAKTSERGVLIATDVASRGLDIPGVALVVIFDFNEHGGRGGGAEAYVHRIGRTGRAGRQGRAVTFVTPEDDGAADLIKILERSGQAVPQELRRLALRGHSNASSGSRSQHWEAQSGPPRKRRRLR